MSDFIDLIRLHVKAGDGGRGCVAWRHEKFYPNGGPFGGDGGNGGDIYFKVDTNETTLTKLRFTRTIKAGNGAPGLIKKMHGKSGDDVIVPVPLGTMIRNAANGDLLADLTEPGQKVLIAHGGKGGLGNYHFATARNDAPEYAQPGEVGESLDIQLELRLLADCGVIGFPSVGKSTFLSVVTNAKPEIAAYQFTTIDPNIGVVDLDDENSFVIADMPGLIEGAGDGRGQLVGIGTFTTPNFAVPYGAHFAEVAVNVKTGELKVRKFIAVQDAGTPINPELALCQMYGAAMKSIGHTLYEDMVLDEDGRCITTTFTDYCVPMINEAPDVFKAELVDINDQYGPYGAKSISEIACNGAAPAIAMAIADATGVWVRTWPITGEKILKAMGKF